MSSVYSVDIVGLRRELPIVPISDDVSIAFLKLYGDTELIAAVVDAIAEGVGADVDVLAGPEAGAILLTHLVADRLAKPYVIARKKHRPYMVNPLMATVESITTVGVQQLFLDDADAATLAGNRVAVIDEVVSTGATLDAMRSLLTRAGGSPIESHAIALEGDDRPDVTALIHLPIFTSS